VILEFSIQNYRSFKEEYCFSLVADTSKSKGKNVFEQRLGNNDTIRILNSAVIYGPNASGKSNLLKAFNTLQDIVISSVSLGDTIEQYDPFLFNLTTVKAPSIFTLTFIGPSEYKYIYHIEYNSFSILEEYLDYYPKSQKRNLFKRTRNDGKIHEVKLGQDYNGRTLKVFNNQSVLTKFGTEEPEELLSHVYLYFKKELVFYKDDDSNHLDIKKQIFESRTLQKRLKHLIKIADTRISDFNFGLLIRSDNDKEHQYLNQGTHTVYDGRKIVGLKDLDFEQESKGTNVLSLLGAQILIALEKGGILLIDEIDTSLHPKLAKFLVMLFQNTHANPKNAQLIFTTHETTFLDKDIFRKDQIWFVEKNEYGESELFSVQDFDGVREDTPFEKWYLAGKFGSLPNIQEIEFIFDNE